MISWYSFELKLLNYNVFSACSRSLMLNHVVCKHGDRGSGHDTSVITFHVEHVAGLGVFLVSQVSSLGLYVLNLFCFLLEIRRSFVSEVSFCTSC